MAFLATRPLTFASAVVAVPGTSVSPTAPVPANCTSLVLLNTGAKTLLFGIGPPGGPLTDGGDSTQIPVGVAFTIPIGDLSTRGIMDESVQPGSGIIFDAIGGPSSVDITYKNTVGSA